MKRLTTLNLLMLFSECNTKYFEDELPIPQFKVIHSYRTLGEYSTYPVPDGHYGDVIKISDNYDYTDNQLRDVMVHEMIHMYLMHFGIDRRCSHGKAFRQMMKDFNCRYGLNMSVTTDASHFKLRDGCSNFMRVLSTLF